MIDPFFYLFLTPLFVAIAYILWRGISAEKHGSKFSFTRAALIIALAVFISFLLFLAWVALYYAGGGH